MFFDRREDPNPNGRILVITCEGNAGFYEIGFLGTPLDAGYSVLGWNHPGFGGSSGSPFPIQETNAMDAVVQVGSTKFWIFFKFRFYQFLITPRTRVKGTHTPTVASTLKGIYKNNIY